MRQVARLGFCSLGLLITPKAIIKFCPGRPPHRAVLIRGGAGYTTRSGIWRCSTGAFECTEQGDELMTFLSGRCHLTDQSTGKSHVLGAGDSLFMPDGHRVTWDIIQEVTKVFFGNKSSGF
ncbi:MAG: hypothetical protein CML59_07160 [Rhodobacteraceae bacterium]|nr:hypothetical protein [Paracoccaceae bacterium]